MVETLAGVVADQQRKCIACWIRIEFAAESPRSQIFWVNRNRSVIARAAHSTAKGVTQTHHGGLAGRTGRGAPD